jgi:YidC/Oxa1 family membrane protein insertase
MERRVLIAIVLSFAVLYGYQALFPPPPDQAAQQQKQTSPKPAQDSKIATVPNASAPEKSNPATSVQGEAPVGAPVAAPARELAIDNPAVHGVFTSRGAVLKS